MAAATTETDRIVANEAFQEYFDNRGQTLKVDREKGIIHNVKLLGFISKKGTVYPPEIIRAALPKYQNRPVNIDHIEPNSRRSLRDRIGVVRNVTMVEGADGGLFGTFHFNPEHSMAKQIAWDAENNPEALGFSHDTRGSSRYSAGKRFCESIDRVLSFDLVANPASTDGMFESEDMNPVASIVPITESTDSPNPKESSMDLTSLTLDQIRKERKDLLDVFQEDLAHSAEAKATADELANLRQFKADAEARDAKRALQESIDSDLKAAGLDRNNKAHVSEVFLEDLTTTADPARRKAKIDDRKALVKAVAVNGNSAFSTPATAPAHSSTPFSSTPFQEDTAATAIPPATAPLASRLARFTR